MPRVQHVGTQAAAFHTEVVQQADQSFGGDHLLLATQPDREVGSADTGGLGDPPQRFPAQSYQGSGKDWQLFVGKAWHIGFCEFTVNHYKTYWPTRRACVVWRFAQFDVIVNYS